MKKKTMKTLSIVFSILILVVVVSAEIIPQLSNVAETREIDKKYRDELLSQTTDKEIKPNVSIECNDDYCLWSAEQKGIISSYHNRVDKKYCDEYNDTIHECITWIQYTDEEIIDMVTDKVLDRLENYANASLERKVNTPFADGSVEITEKKAEVGGL